jgi:hypothetical protein
MQMASIRDRLYELGNKYVFSNETIKKVNHMRFIILARPKRVLGQVIHGLQLSHLVEWYKL